MKSRTPWIWTLAIVVATVPAALAAAADAPPPAPKVSTLAPIGDITAQVKYYIGQLEEAVENEGNYKDAADGKLAKDANTLVLLALACGLADEENPYRATAPGLIEAAQALAKTKDYASAKAGVEKVVKAAGAKDDPGTLQWAKVASLPELMKQVPTINTRLKRNLGKRFDKKTKDNAGDTATLAVIAQGSVADTSAVKNPADTPKWYKYCEAMRDAASSVNKAVHAKDAAAAEKAMDVLQQSCDDCHAVFHPKEKPIRGKPAESD